MSAFVRPTSEIGRKEFATEELLDSFYDRDERYTVQLIHRIAGYCPHAPDFTRWAEDRWIVRFGPDDSRWYENKADAADHFNLCKRQNQIG